VTEGSGGIWERLRCDWSDPNHVVLTTTDSNVWGGASGHTYNFTRRPDGTTDIDVVVVRDGKNLKGHLLGLVLGTIGRGVLERAFGNSVKAVEARNSAARAASPDTMACWLDGVVASAVRARKLAIVALHKFIDQMQGCRSAPEPPDARLHPCATFDHAVVCEKVLGDRLASISLERADQDCKHQQVAGAPVENQAEHVRDVVRRTLESHARRGFVNA